jgi:hypothetical protein
MHNLTRATLDGPRLRELISVGQSVVRGVEESGSPAGLRRLDWALSQLPATELDRQAEYSRWKALEAVGRAEDAEEWDLLGDVEHAVTHLIRLSGATLEHRAVRAIGTLTIRCSIREGSAGAAMAKAWNRGYMLGLEALRAVTDVIYGTGDVRALDKAVTAFLAAVRRAIPYTALYETRRALTEAARAYGLFVIGMRQPMPPGRWEYARCIGTAVYLFEIVPPLVEGHPYGSIAVRRTAEDGTVGPVRYIPFSSIEAHQRANEAVYQV